VATASDPYSKSGASLKDFPEFFGAMVVKELRQGVRGKMFVVPFIAIHVAMLLALGADLRSSSGSTMATMSPVAFALQSIFFMGMPGQSAFWQVAFLLMLVVMPWAGLSALTREREGRNGELLLMAGISRWKIVSGKWLTLCALGLLTATTMLPYLLVRYFVGGMDVVATATVAATLVLLNATANAIAVGLSGYQSLGTRFFVGTLGSIAFFISTMIVTGSTLMLAGMVFGDSELALTICGIGGLATTSLLYCTMGLQLGRLRLKPFVLPYEEATSGGLCSLIILCPILLGIITALTFGTAALVGVILLAFTVIQMDFGERGTSIRFNPNANDDPF